jgi:hypothetical protein
VVGVEWEAGEGNGQAATWHGVDGLTPKAEKRRNNRRTPRRAVNLRVAFSDTGMHK